MIGLYADAACQTLITSNVSAQDGTVTFSGLIKGQSYWLKETAAPKGYQLNSRIYEGTEYDPNVTIENTPSPVEPDDPEKPGNTENSGNTGKPDNPDKPDNLDNPGNPDSPGNEGVSAGSPNIPQAGDDTQLLTLVILFSGIFLAAMTLYRFWGLKKMGKH